MSNSKNDNNKKHLVINKELFRRLKVKAAIEGKQLQELTESLLLKALEE